MRLKGQGSIRKKKHGGWEIRYSARGTYHEESVAKLLRKPAALTTEADALRALGIRMRELGSGRFVGPKAERITIAQVLDDYLADIKLRGSKTMHTIVYNIRDLKDAFGHHRGVDLARADIRAWMEERLETGLSRGYVSLMAAYLRAALRFALKEGVLAQIPYVPTLTLHNARQGFFERAEVQRLLPHCTDWLRPIAEFAYLTGWRKGEILGLQWAWVDWTIGVIRLPDSKNGEGRAVPLRRDGELLAHGKLLDHLWRRRREEERISPWVFHRRGEPIPGIDYAWDAATESAGLADKLFHDFRRTAARDLIAAGCDYVTAMSITGHKSMTVFRRYQITDTRATARGFAKVEAYRAGLLEEARA